jgi:hypothetical protein
VKVGEKHGDLCLATARIAALLNSSVLFATTFWSLPCEFLNAGLSSHAAYFINV